jgi:lysozyme
MQISRKGVAFIAAQEGVVTRAYRDVAGVWTIGAGHTAAAGAPQPVRGMTITRDEALAILTRDLARCEARVAAALATESRTVFDGAASFDFNTGAIDRASWVPAFLAGRRAEARAKLMLWTKAGGRTVGGLMRRREAEARLIFDGNYGTTAELPQPSAAPSEEMRTLQRDLSALDVYHGAIDGTASDAVRAAVIAYQKSHGDLVADGIAGPATRASIARDLAARRAAGVSAGSVATAVAGGAGVAAHVHASHPWAIGIVVACLVAAVATAILAHRWTDEIKRAITPTAKEN